MSTNAQNWIDAGADRSLPFLGVADWLSTWPFFISLGLLIAVFYLFPTGRIPSARWRWPWRAYVTAFVVTVVGFAVQPYSHRVGDVVVTNPVGVEPLDPALGFVLAVAGFAMVASAFISVASLIVRARGAGARDTSAAPMAGRCRTARRCALLVAADGRLRLQLGRERVGCDGRRRNDGVVRRHDRVWDPGGDQRRDPQAPSLRPERRHTQNGDRHDDGRHDHGVVRSDRHRCPAVHRWRGSRRT